MDAELAGNLVQRVAVGDIFRRRAATVADREAVVEKRGGEYLRLTFRELNLRLNQFARALRGLGLGPGDRVGLCGPNSIEYLTALYGCAKGGFVAVPLNPGLAPRDVLYILNHARVKALLVDDALCEPAAALMSGLPGVRHFISLPATGQKAPPPFDDLYRLMEGCSGKEVDDVPIADRDLFEILYTSGTTADPKGVMVSHLAAFITSLANSIELNIGPGRAGSTLMPLFHCAQQTLTTTYLHVGGKTVVFRSFDPGLMLEAIERERLEVIFCLPAMYRAMLDHPRVREFDLSSLSLCIYAMTPMDRRTLEEGMAVFGAPFALGTGQTEFYPCTDCFRPEHQVTRQGNYWGRALLTVDTAIMGPDGLLLPRGEVGEIVWRGPAAMEGYLDDPAATGESRAWGWHHSGDLGYFDEDGLLAFVDRKKDMIKTGGENVPSIKVERVVLNDPRVAGVAVIGLPHEHWVEGVTAVVMPKEGARLTENDVLNLCRQELGGFEVPKKVVFVAQLPRTATGKIQKHILRERFRDLYKGT